MAEYDPLAPAALRAAVPRSATLDPGLCAAGLSLEAAPPGLEDALLQVRPLVARAFDDGCRCAAHFLPQAHAAAACGDGGDVAPAHDAGSSLSIELLSAVSCSLSDLWTHGSGALEAMSARVGGHVHKARGGRSSMGGAGAASKAAARLAAAVGEESTLVQKGAQAAGAASAGKPRKSLVARKRKRTSKGAKRNDLGESEPEADISDES